MKCALIPIVVLPKTSPRPRISRALLRHTLREQIRCVSDGLNPMNVIRDERLNRTIPTNGGTPSCCRPRHPHFRARRLEGCGLLVFWTAISDRAIVDQNERRTRHAKQPARHDLSRRCFPVSIRIWCSGRRVRSPPYRNERVARPELRLQWLGNDTVQDARGDQQCGLDLMSLLPPAGPSILPFWLSTKPAAIEFRCCGTPQGRKIATNNFGIREMSDEIARREQRRSAVPL